jgi:Alpha-L-arabinofuranosidase B, catalytic
VAAGGTTGQVLAKIDGTDYNTGWVNPAVADFPFGTLFYASGVVWDYSIKRNMNLFLVGNCSIAINNMNDGDVAILTLKQDATGSRTVSIIGKSKVAGSSDGSITLSAAAGKEDSLYIIKKGDTFYIQVYLNYTAAAFVNPTSYLDNYASGIKAAFSISKLFSTYSGHAIRVRRDSDNTEADFGFVSGVIDIAGINTFISGANGFISKWYDQSGNGKDAVQATTTSQPKIIMNVLNGLPAIRFDGASSTLLTGSFLDNSFDKSFTSVTLASKTGTGFTLHENNSSYYGSRNNVANNVLYNVGGMSGGAAQNVPAYNNNAEQLLLETFTYDGTNRNVYVNNALYGVVNSPLSTDKMNMTGGMYIGSLGGGSFWWDGDIFTKIYMNSALAVSDVHLSNLKIINDFALEQLPYIKFKGNSLVKGYNSSSGDERYPGTSFPSQLVQAFGGPVTFSFVNEGSNGARIEDIDSSQSASDIYSTNGLCSKLIIIFLEGRNSLATGDSAITAFNALNTYLAKLRAIGYSRIAVLTCEPSEMVPGSPATNNSSGVSTNSFEVQRLLFNAMVLAGTGTNYDYVIDIASDSRVGILSNIANLTYWSSDRIHYTDAGYLVLAELCADTLNTMLS